MNWRYDMQNGVILDEGGCAVFTVHSHAAAQRIVTMLTAKERATSDWCPTTRQHVHSFINMSAWGTKYPVCRDCGYEDVTREFVVGHSTAQVVKETK